MPRTVIVGFRHQTVPNEHFAVAYSAYRFACYNILYGNILKHYFVKKLSGAFFLKAFGFNFKIAIGKFFVL